MPVTIPKSIELTIALAYYDAGILSEVLVSAVTGRLQDANDTLLFYNEAVLPIPQEDLPRNLTLMNNVVEDWKGLVTVHRRPQVLSERRVLIEVLGMHPALARPLSKDIYKTSRKARVLMALRLEGRIP